MNGTTITAAIIGAGLAIATVIALRAALRAAARRLEHLIADAMDHDWHADIDDEYRALIEEGA